MIRIIEATAKERNHVFDLVERLLVELEERPEEFQGIDRAKALRDLESAAGRFTALLALDAAGRVIGVATVIESFAIYAGGNYGVIDVTAPPEDRWERTVGFYEKQGFVFTGPKLRYRLP